MAALRQDRARWAARPWRARGLRLLVYALPIAGSLAFVRVVTELTGTPTSSLWVYLAWWFALSIGATVVVSAVYTLARRLLPLGALLELSLAFPDEAPSRFRVALRTGTVEELEGRLRSLHESRRSGDASEAAAILLQLVAALDVHDRITRGHAERVRAYAAALGKELGLSADELDRLNWAALLHDIGKLDVSAEILNKPGRPSDEEWEQLRLHPLYGETLVAPLAGWLGPWLDAVGYHHEHWDGAGYPRAVAGEAIPLAGRIVAIADVFDVITSSRSYKRAATPAEARDELARCSGSQFDPRLVRAFVNMSLGRLRLVLGPVSWLTHAPFLARLPLTPSFGAAIAGAATIATTAATGLALPHSTAHAVVAAGPATVAVETAPRAAAVPAAARPLPAPVTHSPRRRVHARPRRLHVTHRPPAHRRPPSIETKKTATGTTPKPKPPPPPAPATTTNAATPRPAPSPKPPKPATPRAAPPPPARTPPPTTATTTRPPPPPPTTTTPPKQPPTTTTPPQKPPPPPAANVAPTFAVAGSQTVLEDSGPQTVAGFATAVSPGPAGEVSQSVSFAVSSDRPALFGGQPTISPDGTLAYTPAANANGSATVTVTAHDDGGTANGGSDTSAAQTFTITVTPVNDAPSFTPGPNQLAVSLLGIGTETVPGWATGISPGPPDEAGQSVSFVVTAGQPSYFTTQPAISPGGTLTYRAATLAIGKTATVTVRLVDSGGTANGGADTSATATFTISISVSI